MTQSRTGGEGWRHKHATSLLSLLGGAGIVVGCLHVRSLPLILVVNLLDILPGKEADYAQYLRRVQPILDRHRARIVMYGMTRMVFKGEQQQEYCGIIEYPSLRNLKQFSTDPEFEEIRPLRDESTTNYVLTAVQDFPTMDDAAEHLERAAREQENQ